MLIIQSSLSIEDLRDSIVNEYLNRRGDDRDAFLEGAEYALEQLGIPLADLSHRGE